MKQEKYSAGDFVLNYSAGELVLDYLGCTEVDIDEITGLVHQIFYEKYLEDVKLFEEE